MTLKLENAEEEEEKAIQTDHMLKQGCRVYGVEEFGDI